MQNRATTVVLNRIHCSPRKVNLVLGLIRSKHIFEALKSLTFCHKAVAKPIAKLLKSAISNVRSAYDVRALYVSEVSVGKSLVLKRRIPRARGNNGDIKKRYSRVSLSLGVLDINFDELARSVDNQKEQVELNKEDK